jgi:hypothetical protein
MRKLQPGDEVFVLVGHKYIFQLLPAHVVKLNRKSVKVVFDHGHMFPEETKLIKYENVAHADELICIVIERNGFGGWRIERELYENLRVKASEIANNLFTQNPEGWAQPVGWETEISYGKLVFHNGKLQQHELIDLHLAHIKRNNHL